MGNWKLEVGRMGIYMVFPVITFYVFNQPQWFEEFTIAKKKELFQPTSKEDLEVIPVFQTQNIDWISAADRL